MRDYLLLTAVALPLAGALIALGFGSRLSARRHVYPMAVLAAGLMLLSTLGFREEVFVRLPLPRLEPAMLFGTVPGYLADRLSRTYLLLVGLLGLGGLIASSQFPADQADAVTRRQGALLLLLASSASFLLSANFLTAYLSWCLLDLAILLVQLLPEGAQGGRIGPALQRMIVSQLAGLALLFTAIQGVPEDGTSILTSGHTAATTWLLILAGMVRAGIYPLHPGLPLTTGAPAWQVALQRLLPVTTGLYLLTRVVTEVQVVPEALALLSGLSLLATGFLVWLAPDEDHALAYVVANQAALAVLSLTLDHPQTDVAALAMAINLVLAIGLWFLTPGPSTVAATGRFARWVGRLRMVALGAVVGVPPALGFVGRWGLYRYAVENGLWLLLACAALSTAFVVAGLLPRLRPAEGTIPTLSHGDLTRAVALLAVPFIVLGLQPLLLSPALEALGGPDTYLMLLRLVRTTGQSVGAMGMAAILLPLAAGYATVEIRQGESASFRALRDRAFRVLGLGWLHRGLSAAFDGLGRFVRSAAEPLEGDRYLSWTILLGLLAILLLVRYV